MDHWRENYCEQETNLFFLKKCVASLFTLFENVNVFKNLDFHTQIRPFKYYFVK